MTDNNEEGGQVAGGQESPTPSPSPTPTPQPSAVDVGALETTLKAYIDQTVERQWQSGKDTRIAKLTGKVDDFESQFARLQELMQTEKMSQKQALQYMKMEELLAQKGSQPGGTIPPSGAGGNQTPAASADHTALLQGLGLDPNSSDVTAVLREAPDYASQVTRFVQLAETKRQAQARPPNAAQVVPAGGSGQAVEPPDAEKLGQELEKLMQRGLRSPEDHKQFTALQSQLEKALRQAGSG